MLCHVWFYTCTLVNAYVTCMLVNTSNIPVLPQSCMRDRVCLSELFHWTAACCWHSCWFWTAKLQPSDPKQYALYDTKNGLSCLSLKPTMPFSPVLSGRSNPGHLNPKSTCSLVHTPRPTPPTDTLHLISSWVIQYIWPQQPFHFHILSCCQWCVSPAPDFLISVNPVLTYCLFITCRPHRVWTGSSCPTVKPVYLNSYLVKSLFFDLFCLSVCILCGFVTAYDPFHNKLYHLTHCSYKNIKVCVKVWVCFPCLWELSVRNSSIVQACVYICIFMS